MSTKKNKPDWELALIEMDKDTRPYLPPIKLTIDGYNVSFKNEIKRRQIVIIWYVDGYWKGEYSNPDSEIGAKFGCPKYIKRNPNYITLHKKLFKEDIPKRKVCAYNFYWTTAKELISHLKKTCKNIEYEKE